MAFLALIFLLAGSFVFVILFPLSPFLVFALFVVPFTLLADYVFPKRTNDRFRSKANSYPDVRVFPRWERDINQRLKADTKDGVIEIRATFIDFVHDVGDIDTEDQYSNGVFPKSWFDLGDMEEISEMLQSNGMYDYALKLRFLKNTYSHSDKKPDLPDWSEIYKKYGPIIEEVKKFTKGKRLFNLAWFPKLGVGPRNTRKGDCKWKNVFRLASCGSDVFKGICFAPSYSALLIVRPFASTNPQKPRTLTGYSLIGACCVGDDAFRSKHFNPASFPLETLILQSNILDEGTDNDNKKLSQVAKQSTLTALQSNELVHEATEKSTTPGFEAIKDTETSEPNHMTGIHYIMFWKCACGHEGFDQYIQQRPGAMRELVEVFYKHGIKASIRPLPLKPSPTLIRRVRLLISVTNLGTWLRICLSEWPQNKKQASPDAMRHTDHPATINDKNPYFKTATGPTNGAQSSRQTTNANALGSNQQAQVSTGVATGTSTTPAQSNQPSPSPAVHNPANTTHINIREDFILLCMKAKKFFTNRHDLQVTMTRDRELFEAFRNEYHAKFGWAYRQFSFQTVQKINFVKFNLHPRYEVDGIVTGMPPETAGHYTCEPRRPDLVPPLGSDFLMHRFTSPTNCFHDDICLRRFPKRVGERPSPGIDPDLYTGWGMHLEQGLDLERICLVLFFGIASGGMFGLLWGIFKSVQDGFSIASFIVGSEAVAVAIVQVLLTVGAI